MLCHLQHIQSISPVSPPPPPPSPFLLVGGNFQYHILKRGNRENSNALEDFNRVTATKICVEGFTTYLVKKDFVK